MPPALKAVAAYGLIRTLAATWRVREERREIFERCLASERPTILGFHHGRTFALLPLMSRPGNGRWMSMCSKSRDGDAMAWVEERFGLEVIRGSSGSGGLEAIVDMIRYVRANPGVGASLAVDGSRGPRGVAKGGVVALAQRTGGTILPVAAAARPGHTFERAWDRTLLPLPFARVQIVYGEPLEVAKRLDSEAFESLRQQTCDRLVALHHEANRLLALPEDRNIQA